MASRKVPVDPFAGIEHADRLSAETKAQLLKEARAGLETVTAPPSFAMIAISDLLTFAIGASAAFILILRFLSDHTASLL